MPYQIDRFNGTTISSVPDQTVDSTSCDLKLIGKNYAGYGEVQNENFLHLLENFRGLTAPRRPIIGQLWFDETANKIKYRDTTSSWRSLTVTEVGPTTPTSLTIKDQGNFWFDTDRKQVSVFDGSDMIVVGPEQAPGFGITRLVSDTVRDNGNTEYAISKLVIDDTVIATISNDTFTIGDITVITGFTEIKKGITLINTSATGVTSSDHRFWGTAGNSLKLAGYSIADFVLRTPGGSTFDDSGFTVGNAQDLKIFIENGNSPVLNNQSGSDFVIRITDNTEVIDYVFNDSGLIPGTTELQDLGSTAFKWNTVHATEIQGNLVGNVEGNVIGGLTGNSVGTHRGNIQAADLTSAYNYSTKTFYGSFDGTVTGTVNADSVTVSGNIIADRYVGDVYASDDSIAYNSGTKAFTGTFNGNASSATILSSDVLINGVGFDGSNNITIFDETKVSKLGDSLVGFLTLHANPVNDFHAATKKYVEDYVEEYYTSKPLVFSLDVRGLSNSTIASLLNTLAPVVNYQPGQLARIAGTVQNVTTSVSTTRGGWISVSFVNSVAVATTVNNPTRYNDLVFRVNSLGTAWEYQSGG
jgi:hypothetical protein